MRLLIIRLLIMRRLVGRLVDIVRLIIRLHHARIAVQQPTYTTSSLV